MVLPLLSALPALVLGHGAVVYPPPRQAVDKDLLPWNGKVPRTFPDVESKTGWCPVPGSADGKPSGQNGQGRFELSCLLVQLLMVPRWYFLFRAVLPLPLLPLLLRLRLLRTRESACFWFSNGCAVGCDACDGSSRGPIPGQGARNETTPPTGIGRNKVGPNGVVCGVSNGVKPTMCDPNHRTVNIMAECGGPDDWYFYSPWRAPVSTSLQSLFTELVSHLSC
eukprot:COSAG05_NODE_2813_length_2611_cov_1.736863_2_plen_223_part_00